MTRAFTIAAYLGLALLPQALPAQTPSEASSGASATASTGLVGNPENGRTLAFTCQGCHGVRGYRNVYPHYHVPLIGGQSEAYLVNALREYRQGTRKHPTMQSQAQSFSDQDIADLAAFLSGLKK